MNNFLYSLVDNLTCNLYSSSCKNCITCVDCKKCKNCRDNGIEWCKICKACKKLSDYCNDCNKIYENLKFYFENIYVNKKKTVCSWVRKMLEKIIISPKYHISTFHDLFSFCEEDHDKFAVLVRKDVVCYEYIDSWEKLKEKQLPTREKLFSSLSNKAISDWYYKHAQIVWNVFKMKQIEYYLHLYNM